MAAATKFLVLLIVAVTATGHSLFGHHWAGSAGLDDLYESRFGRYPAHHDYHGRYHDDGRYDDYHGYHNGYHNDYEDGNYYDDYFGHWNRPCPHYQPLQYSRWQVAQDRHLRLQVLLPGVNYRDIETRLSEDASAIHINGARTLPSRGRACLPPEAKVSHNGRYEILAATIPVPVSGDVQKATVQKMRNGEGLVISMPPRAHPQRTPAQNTAKERIGREHVTTNAHQHTRPKVTTPPRRVTPQASRTEKRVSALQQPVRTAMRPKVVLPPSTGIQVEEVDFPWPEKRPDACAGWVDNRGEFQSY